jgi:uncharacterized protein YfaS (alpha-2-macroglobulin family)
MNNACRSALVAFLALVPTLSPGSACGAGTAGVEARPSDVVQASPDAAAAPAFAPIESVRWTGSKGEAWKEVDRLVGEQKLEEASRLVEKAIEAAKAAHDGEEWTRALVRWVQLRTALHGVETAVRFLREQPWPDDLLGRTAVQLYYAQSLTHYAHAYSWEIGRREKVDTRGVVDLKAWTAEQIFAEALRAYADVWSWRDRLGGEKAGALSEYLEPNDYPAGVRPTLRDAATYLLVELLSDTTGWRPEQSADVYRLDLGALLADAAPPADPADASAHPLAKAASALSDLEAWHAARGDREAALEARLERQRRLHDSFTEAPDRERIRKDLERRLSSCRGLPWWTTGMATLADFTRADDDPDSLVRARQVAITCMESHRDSVGWQRCRAIRAQIEAPDFTVEAMASDAPDRKSIGISARNLDRAYLRSYPFDLQRHLDRSDDWNTLPDWQEVRDTIAKGRPSKEWSVALAATPDFRSHRTFATVQVADAGFHIVYVSARPGFGRDDNRILAVPMAVGDLVLQTRQEDEEVEARVLSGATGRPVEGAEVFLYRYDWRNRHKAVDSRKTGADGVVRMKLAVQGQGHFLFARKGRDVAVDPNWLNAYRSAKVLKTTATLLYTDRSIYRPLQKVLFKAVVYAGRPDAADWRTAPSTPVGVSLVDPNGETVETRPLVTNRHGTVSGEFVIPAGRLLGQWQVRASPDGWAQVRVEEYKRPTFEAKLLDPEEPLRLNRPATLKGEVRYYFGLPVTSGKVRWRVVRSPVYPWWWSAWWGGGGERTRVVATGIADLQDDGRFKLTFTPEADERVAKGGGVSFRYAVTADATDEGGETRSAERSFRLGFVAVEATIRSDAEFLREALPGTLTIVRTDLDGTPAPGLGKWKLVRLAEPSKTLLPADQPLPAPPEPVAAAYLSQGDRERERWDARYDPAEVLRLWADGGEVSSGAIEHNAKGEARLQTPPLVPGAYRLRYETADAFGARFETSKELVVAGPRTALAVPAALMVEKGSARVGEVARVLVACGLADQPLTLEIWKAGRRVEERRLESGTMPSLIEIPIGEGDRGGFAVTLTALRDHQWVRLERQVWVPWDDRELKVEFATFRDRMRPGSKETWTVKVTGPAGRDAAVAAAELLAYMYDRSLDVFAPHVAPSPLSLFPHRASAAWVRTTLGAGRVLWADTAGFAPLPDWPHLQADRLKFEEGWGIGGPGHRYFRGGGGIMKSMAMPAAAPPSPRGGARYDFADETVEGNLATPQEAAVMSRSAALEGKAEESAGEKDNAGRAVRGSAAPAVELRSEFRETAFWEPHLLTGADGTATISFTVPDSVTSWNVFVHAVTDDLKSGSLSKEARTVKDLMVRPYLPRFLREGDRADLKVVVNNASDRELKGTLSFEILDAATQASVLSDFVQTREARLERPFTVAPGAGATLTFPVTTPARPGQIAFKVTARAGDFSDGELRPIPVLPGRMHLMQSRFVTLKGKAKRTMTFADLARNDDPTRIDEQLVVTLDAQLFYQVLSALPYLVNYPYECVEQTLNRFLSTGIIASLYRQYPAVERMAGQMAKRTTQWESFDAPDPNRKMALEETPWLMESRGGEAAEKDLLNVLDPRITRAQRDGALAKLVKAQTSSGAFPWFPGGPPSPWMTLYVVHSFANALEFGVDVPRDVVQRAWAYLHRYYVDEVVREMIGHDCCWEWVTFLAYTLSSYPDLSWTGGTFTEGDRKTMLDFSFRHWKRHAPYSKGQLTLALKRAGRAADARLVWDSVMDSAKTEEDQGTFWAPEDRAWLWYNDSIETHAFALRTLMEVSPDDSRQDGLVLWLFLNKKLNHWKSTRATAEVVYSLAHYLKKTAQLGVREAATVDVGGQRTEFVFEPDRYTGKKNQVVVPGEKIDSARSSTVTVEKTTPGYMFASATWHFSTERLPDEDRGDFLKVSRTLFKRVKEGREVTLQPLKDGARLEAGDEVEVQISLRSKHAMEYVHLRDPRGAGFEPEGAVSRHRWDLGIYWYEEVRDSGTNFFFEQLPQGEYTFKYRIRAATAGTFKVASATAQPMYAPEFAAYSAGTTVTIADRPL